MRPSVRSKKVLAQLTHSGWFSRIRFEFQVVAVGQIAPSDDYVGSVGLKAVY